MCLKIDIIGVPLDLGANRRGVDMGPYAIRYAGLKKAIENIGVKYNDFGNINVPVPENTSENENSKMKYISEITEVNQKLSQMVEQSLLNQHIPVVLGGDHSIAVGTILGSQSILKNIGVIWMDAHGDFNTSKTTLSGNLHGMSLAASTGIGETRMSAFKNENTNYIDSKKVVLIGVRDLDNEEVIQIKNSGASIFTMEDIDMQGMRKIMNAAIQIAGTDTEGIHLSFDIDVINPNEAPGVGTPVNGGLTYREAHLAVEMLHNSNKICSMEFVELNPILDKRNQTGELAVSLICSALGKRILRETLIPDPSPTSGEGSK